MAYRVVERLIVRGEPWVEDGFHSHVRYGLAFFLSYPLFIGLGFLGRGQGVCRGKRSLGLEAVVGQVVFWWWLEGCDYFEQRKQILPSHSSGKKKNVKKIDGYHKVCL